jgi:hypothetical protein
LEVDFFVMQGKLIVTGPYRNTQTLRVTKNANNQHTSWSTQRRILEFPGENAECGESNCGTDSFGEHQISPLINDLSVPSNPVHT